MASIADAVQSPAEPAPAEPVSAIKPSAKAATPLHPLKTLENTLDIEAITAKYQAERLKRLRGDGVRQYKPTTGSYSRFRQEYGSHPSTREPIESAVKVLIVGAGIGGLVSAVKLKEHGVEDFLILDKAAGFGGTWHWNQFPGAACDVESYVYLPFLEETGYIPQRRYSYSHEILEHFARIVAKWDLGPKTQLQTEITSMVWDESIRRWHVHTNHGDHIVSQFVITATGTLHEPKLPSIDGIDEFEGHQFHSGRWDFGVTGGDATGRHMDKLADKTVSMVGTGATAMQILPWLSRNAKKVYVFQRTPLSVTPRANTETDYSTFASMQPGWQRERIDKLARVIEGIDASGEEFTTAEGLEALTRGEILREGRQAGVQVKDEDLPELLRLADFRLMQKIRDRVEASVHDSVTAERLKPWYPFMCKRPGFHNDYLATFNNANVELVDTDGKGVSHLTRNGVMANGREYATDLIVYSTGFDFIFSDDFYRRTGIRLVGAQGRTIDEAWEERGPSTLWGIHMREFPNLFNVGAMQSGVGVTWTHTCYIAGEHIAAVIANILKKGTFDVVVPSEEAEDDWTKQMDEGAEMRLMFHQSCPPGYYNKEGKPDEGSARAGPFPKGVTMWANTLKEWRDEGNMKGLEMR